MTVEVVFNAPNVQALVNAAVAMGYYNALSNTITQNGAIASGGAYFLNLGDGNRGIVAYQANGDALAGIWGRLRHNGDPSAMPVLPENSGILLYTYSADLGGWTSDGTTLAPSYVADIGLIA